MDSIVIGRVAIGVATKTNTLKLFGFKLCLISFKKSLGQLSCLRGGTPGKDSLKRIRSPVTQLSLQGSDRQESLIAPPRPGAQTKG